MLLLGTWDPRDPLINRQKKTWEQLPNKNGHDHHDVVLLMCDGVIDHFFYIFYWWFGIWLDDFSHYIGNVIIPTDEVHHFSEG